MLRDFESALDQNSSPDLKNSSSDEYHVRLLCQYLRGARQGFVLKKEKLSTSLAAVTQTPCFIKVALQSSDSSVRREAYTLITEMALSWESQEESFIYSRDFVRSVFKALGDKESSNYLEIMSMVVAFGRQFRNVWDLLDVKKDFYQPVSQIAFSSNQTDTTVEVNKTFLPLIAILPEKSLDMREIAHIVAGIWKGHSITGHLPKTCSTVQTTIAVRTYIYVFVSL